MKITIEIKNPENKKDLYWFFRRLEAINKGTGVAVESKLNSGEKNSIYLDGDGPTRIKVSVDGI